MFKCQEFQVIVVSCFSLETGIMLLTLKFGIFHKKSSKNAVSNFLCVLMSPMTQEPTMYMKYEPTTVH